MSGPISLPDDNEDYFLAPQHTRPFGAGLKRKRVDFVPASTTTTTFTESTLPTTPSTASDAGAKYLSIVLGHTDHPTPTGPSTRQTSITPESTSTAICPICQLPLEPNGGKAHESSIAHQLGLNHSHPPSHLDRQRKGLKYLEGYGWDPDSRLGLGARSEGIRVPIKAVEKRDTAGLGLRVDGKDDDDDDDVVGSGKKRTGVKQQDTPVLRLNAKQVRKLEEEKSKKAEKLRGIFYGEDLSKYLGPDG